MIDKIAALFGINIKGRKHQLLVGMAIMLFGLTLIEISVAYQSEYTFYSVVFYCVLGAVISIFGFVRFMLPGISKKRHEMDFTEYFCDDVEQETRGLENKREKVAHGKIESFLTQFRKDYSLFFREDHMENPLIQNDTTQIFKNIVEFQKRRLDRLKVKMEMISERRNYSGKPVCTTKFFDGKYEITDVSEEIEARRRYSLGGKTLFVKKDAQIAHYSIINAKRIGGDKIVCPNCGAETTRENLIDGCDFCGTEFQVEDLGEKISTFALRDNYETAYAKFKTNRLERVYNFTILVYIVMYLFISLCFLAAMFYESTSGVGSGDPFNAFLFALSDFAIVGIFSGIFVIPFIIAYMLVVFPLVEVAASKKYHEHKNLSQLKKAQKRDDKVEKRIRESDPLFSVADFYSNVQNKLASVLFADSEMQINAFAEANLTEQLGTWQNILDFDVDDISLEDYEVGDGEQKASVSMEISTIELKKQKADAGKRKIQMIMVKSAACKTQAVCEPFVMRCSQCGGRLSAMKGMVCEYCGSKADLKQHDWVIRKIASIQ